MDNLEYIKSLPFFFIIGRPRSGTTLLQSIMDAHPSVIIPFESPVILNLYKKYGKINYWSKKTIKEFINDLYKVRKFDVWPMDKVDLEKSLYSETGNNSFINLIKIIYSHYISLFKKDKPLIIGDKNPIYSLYLKKLVKIFPDAKYIYILRDYRDHILSVKKVGLIMQSTAITAFRWKKSLKQLEKAINKKRNIFFIRYEDFVSKPEKHLNNICDFLNIPYKPEILEFYKHVDKNFDNYEREKLELFHGSLMKPINKDAVGKWKVNLSEKDQKIADFICGKKAKRYNYQAVYNKFNLRVFLHILPRYLYISLQSLLSFFIDVLPFRANLKIRNRKLIFTRIYLKVFKKDKYNSLIKNA